jgi:two-component system phosphate regulon response regulator PhoB
LTSSRRILVVEDERDLAELVALNLERAGFETAVVHDGREAIASVTRARPDLILLDVMLPELSGTEVAKRLRVDPATTDIPIIMLTAKAEEADEVIGLAAGADDYVTKPFSLRVLLARIDSVLRRSEGDREKPSRLRAGSIEIRTDTHRVIVDGAEVKLTLTEFRLLAALIEGSGTVLTRKDLMRRAIGPGVRVTPRTIDVHVTALRRKLGDAGRMIETVRGVGYRLEQQAAAER